MATLVVALLVAASACSSSDSDSLSSTGSESDAVPDETVVAQTEVAGEPEESGEELDGIDAIVADLNDYWSEADAELDFEYEPVPPDRVITGDAGEVCSGEPIDPEELEGNAFVDPSCTEGLTVAYDPDYLEASLARAEATMAHEWGHVVQAQAEHIDISFEEDGLPVDAELQADCFAGAWAAERAEAEIELLREDTAEAGDTDDVELDDPEAHGLPEERVVAFDVGLDGGPVACVDELIAALP